MHVLFADQYFYVDRYKFSVGCVRKFST